MNYSTKLYNPYGDLTSRRSSSLPKYRGFKAKAGPINPYLTSKRQLKQFPEKDQKEFLNRIDQLVAQNPQMLTVKGLRNTRLRYQHYSQTPHYASKEMRKTMRHNKANLLYPYQYHAENRASSQYNWKGNVIGNLFGSPLKLKQPRSQSSGRRQYNMRSTKSLRSTRKRFFNTPTKMSQSDRELKNACDPSKKFGTNQTFNSPAKQRQQELFSTAMSKSTRHTMDQDFVQEFLVKGDDKLVNQQKCEKVHKRLGFFLKQLSQQKIDKQFLLTHIKTLKNDCFKEQNKIEKSCGKSIIYERHIQQIEALIASEAEKTINQTRSIQAEYEENYELNQQISQIKEQVQQTKNSIAENEQAIKYLAKERLDLQIKLRHSTEMREGDRKQVNIGMRKLGQNMKKYNVQTIYKTDFNHGLAQADVKNPKLGHQIKDFRDLYFNLHSKRC